MAKPRSKRLPVRRPDGTIDCKPLYVVWEITHRCDQRCRFCGTRAGGPRKDELATDECLDIVRQLKALGTREIAIHGGEAYLFPGWLDVIRAVADAGIDATMVTGGRGFTPEVASAASAAGLRAASVSIDGTAETHDALRGIPGSHASALGAARNLRAAGVKVGCNTQLNRMNFRELPLLTELLRELKPYGWQVQLMVPMGRAADAEDLWLEPYDLLELMPLVAEAARVTNAAGIPLWPGNNLGYFGPFEHVLRGERMPSGHSGGCGGGIGSMGIEANGDIKACSALTSVGYVGGNVRTKPIREIWENAAELRFTRDFKLDDLWGFCRGCYYAEVCKGGCIWTASTLLGRRGNNPYCHHRALEMLGRGKRERIERVEAAPGERRDQGRFEVREEQAPAEWAKAVEQQTWGPSRRGRQPASPDGAGP